VSVNPNVGLVELIYILALPPFDVDVMLSEKVALVPVKAPPTVNDIPEAVNMDHQ
jgi:hypothetical protein